MIKRKTQFSILLAAMMVVAMIMAGCGTELNEDYESPGGGEHPFEDEFIEAHGEYLASVEFDFLQCVQCHGEDLHGVEYPEEGYLRNCYECHSRTSHIIAFENSNNHSDSLRNSGWNLNRCLGCHQFTGSASDVEFGGSCSSSSCHGDASGGPTACNVCHGNFAGDPDNPNNWAPPAAIEGGFGTDNPRVGAHQAHLTVPSGIFAAVECGTCHLVPDSWDAEGHIGDSTVQAELVFSSPADSRRGDPEYDYDSGSCSSTHCHGNAEPVWTQVDGTFNACGSCHSLPPESYPHYPGAQCYLCHSSVIDEEMNFIAPELHVNGIVNRN